MKKGLIALGVIGVGVVAYFVINKVRKKKWDEKCVRNGGIVENSGSTCDMTNCDKTKHSCDFFA